MWWLLACARVPAPDLPQGRWGLVSDTARGVIEVGGDCTIHLAGPGWGTVGPVRCEAHETPGWFVFPLQTGAGKALAVGRWEDDAVVIPLGSRDGEFDVRLARQDQVPEVGRPDLEAERLAWTTGRFRLLDGDRLVGAVALGEPPLVEVYDSTWLSDGPVEAVPGEQGPDLLLEFDAEPTLAGSRALLLINRPLRDVVIPSGPQASLGDRRLRLEPGVVGEDERIQARALAIAQADKLEAERTGAVLAQVAAELASPCPDALPVDLAPYFVGYAVTLQDVQGVCTVALEPEPTQHRRRYRGRAPE